MSRQNCGLGHETDTPIPVYSVAAGTTCWGPVQVEPFHSMTAPVSSAATQNDRVGQEMESNCRPGSSVWRAVQALSPFRTTMASPLTMAHRVTVGQAMETGTVDPGRQLD